MRWLPRIRPPAPALVFFFSGLASLIYQVAWQRLLTIHFGVGALSITLIVSVTMFGLGLGSLLGGRLAGRVNAYSWYAGIEGTLGAIGLLSFPLILALGRVTAAGSPAVAFSCLFAFLTLPMLFMGITLPLLATIAAGQAGEFVSSLSRLYFLNTLGASLGALVTSYLLVSLLGLDGCTYLAAAINALLALTILTLKRLPTKPLTASQPAHFQLEASPGLGRWVYALALVSGFLAIGYEIIWYRVIGILVKDSPYAFASVLAIYLLGIAFGSLALPRYLAARPHHARRNLFFTLQFFIGLTVLLTFSGFYTLAQYSPLKELIRYSFSSEFHPSLAFLAAETGLDWRKSLFLLLDVFFWPMALLLVPTLLMGASFPLIASLALSRPGGEGEAVGTTYFFAVVGNVLGGLLTGLLLLPWFGTERTLFAFASLGLLFGLAGRTQKGRGWPEFVRLAGLFLLLQAGVVFFPRPGALYAALHAAPFTPSTARFEEGLDAVVLTYEHGDRVRNFINGQGHGYRPGPLFLAEAIEGLSHVAAPRKILVIGFGAGSITEAALLPPEVEQVTVVELSKTSMVNLRKSLVINQILDDPRIRLIIDDGRRFLQRTTQQFDVILMDPLRTTTAYSNNLHSRQFFQLAGRHLAPGGILMVGGVADSPVIPRTLLEEFDYVRAYAGFSLASRYPLRQDRPRFDRLLSLFPADIQGAIRGFTRDALEGTALLEAVRGVPSNQDWRPVSEYYLAFQLRQWLKK